LIFHQSEYIYLYDNIIRGSKSVGYNPQKFNHRNLLQHLIKLSKIWYFWRFLAKPWYCRIRLWLNVRATSIPHDFWRLLTSSPFGIKKPKILMLY